MIIPLREAMAGDLVFTHSRSVIGKAIRLAERLHWRTGSTYSHVAILDAKAMTGWRVIQAERRGVTRGVLLSDLATPGKYTVVSLPEDVCRSDVLEFARSKVGTKYGVGSLFSILFNILTPHFVRLDFRRDNTLICSALASLALLAGGWMSPIGDYYSESPAQLWSALVLPTHP